MKKRWTNKENLELSVKELNKILDILGNVNLFTEYHKKDNQRKMQDAYSKVFDLRNRLNIRLESLEEEECIISQQENGLQN